MYEGNMNVAPLPCGTMRILVADDDPVTTMLLKRTLERGGHQVHTARDGREAWDLWRHDPADVLITDWHMPSMDGLELTRKVRSLRSYAWIIMLTGDEADADLRATIEAGVDDLLGKPLNAELLHLRLKVAERVTGLNQRLRAVAQALPMCLCCKSVRDQGDQWKMIEEFLGEDSGMAFTHGYCPNCAYDQDLKGELDRWRAQGAVPVTDTEALLDKRVFGAIRRFDHEESPALLDDLVEGLVELQGRLIADLRSLDPQRPPRTIPPRIRTFQERARELGAGRLAEALGALFGPVPRPPIEAVVALVEETTTALRAEANEGRIRTWV